MALRYLPDPQRWNIARQNTAEATKKLLVETAKRLHGEVMRADPRPSTFYRSIDGTPGGLEESVSPFGRIDYFYPRLEEVAQYAMEVLFQVSPVDSGDYRTAHTLFVDGTAVTNLKGRQRGQEVSIANPLPYARKIEVGAMTMRVPGTDHVYETATRRVKARYGKIAEIKFTFRGTAGLLDRNGRRSNRIDRDTRQPVMLISELI